MPSRPDTALVVGLQLVAAALTVGWFATGGALAPDGGLQQVDVLTLREQVYGVTADGGRPTLLVTSGTCPQQAQMALARYGRPDGLPTTYGLLVLTDQQTRDLALGEALTRCRPGYALVDGDGYVRYRTYDPGFGSHADEQRVLLGAL